MPSNDGSSWRHVSSPSDAPAVAEGTEPVPSAASEPTTAPQGASRLRGRRRGPARAAEPVPRRHRGLLIGLIISALVVGVAAIGGYLVSRYTPETISTQTVAPTRPPFKLELPLQVGEYSRDANQGNTPTKGVDGKTTLSATYSKGGQPAFVLLVARPYTDGKVFMQDLNMNVVAPVEDGMCGVSGDNNNDGCSLIRDNTGILVLSTVDMSRTDLMALTRRIADQMAG